MCPYIAHGVFDHAIRLTVVRLWVFFGDLIKIMALHPRLLECLADQPYQAPFVVALQEQSRVADPCNVCHDHFDHMQVFIQTLAWHYVPKNNLGLTALQQNDFHNSASCPGLCQPLVPVLRIRELLQQLFTSLQAIHCHEEVVKRDGGDALLMFSLAVVFANRSAFYTLSAPSPVGMVA